MNVRQSLSGIDTKDYKKKLEILRIKEEIQKEIQTKVEGLLDLNKELKELMDSDFDKLKFEYISNVRFHLQTRWVCGKQKGEWRLI